MLCHQVQGSLQSLDLFTCIYFKGVHELIATLFGLLNFYQEKLIKKNLPLILTSCQDNTGCGPIDNMLMFVLNHACRAKPI